MRKVWRWRRLSIEASRRGKKDCIIQSFFPRLDASIDNLRQRHTFRISSSLDDAGLEEIKTIFREADVKVLRRKLMKKNGLYYSEWYVAGPRLEQKNVVRQLL